MYLKYSETNVLADFAYLNFLSPLDYTDIILKKGAIFMKTPGFAAFCKSRAISKVKAVWKRVNLDQNQKSTNEYHG